MIIRRRRTRDFTILENEVLNDDRLTLEAMGLLAWLRSRPNNWQMSVQHLRKRFKIGRDKAYDIVTELLNAGWIIREHRRDPETKAFVGVDYVVLDTAQQDEPEAQVDAHAGVDEEAEPLPEKPDTAEPFPALPDTANQEAVIRTDSGTRTEKETRTESLSPSPVAARAGPKGEREGLDEIEKQFEAFWAGFPVDDTMIKLDAWDVFRRLTAEERRLAVRHAPRYAEACRKRSKQHVVDAANWLRKRQMVAMAERDKAQEARRAPGAATIVEGTPQWSAWTVLYRLRGMSDVPLFLGKRDPKTDKRVVTMTSEWPLLGRGLNADVSSWVPVAQGSREYAAWMERLVEAAGGLSIGLRNVTVDGREQLGLLVPPTPTGFPPAKGASGADPQAATVEPRETGPPSKAEATGLAAGDDDPRLRMGQG